MSAWNFKDLTGQTFGELTVLQRFVEKGKHAKWVCQCSCGETTVVLGTNLLKGNTRSCGHIRKPICVAANTTHGESGTRLYRTWRGIISRCRCKGYAHYADYGGRGISFCEEWKDYSNFARWARENGYDDSLTIERIDVNGDYCPDNCSWVPFSKQGRNKRNNALVTIDNETRCVAEWAEISGLKEGTIRARLRRGWGAKEAVFGELR